MDQTTPPDAAPVRLSLSRDRVRVLLLEGVHEDAARLMRAAGYTQVAQERRALDGDALAEAVRGVHLLGIRSRTQLRGRVLEQADKLAAIGCFCIGTNQVDLAVTRARGIPVFNAPFSNTRSVAELVIGELVMLLRGVFPKSVAAHRGGWEKSAANSHELRGKTLGIVGYGNIGSQLSVLAEAMGMRVVYFDTQDRLPHGNAEAAASLHALLVRADAVSLHVPETAETEGMIGADEIARMKPGSVLINLARGRLVDLGALAAALGEGRLRGAGVDVFPEEPAGNGGAFATPLQGLPNVILTPHIGGSTEEAQERIASEVGRKLIEYSDTGTTLGAVNFPQVQLPARQRGTRFMHVHRNVPGLLGRLNAVFSERRLNIAAQYLQTEGDLGYVVIEAEGVGEAGRDILAELRALDGTVRARLLYAGA